jgi:hypothetical protein
MVYLECTRALECVNPFRNPGENREVVTRQHLQTRPCIKQKVNKLDLDDRCRLLNPNRALIVEH